MFVWLGFIFHPLELTNKIILHEVESIEQLGFILRRKPNLRDAEFESTKLKIPLDCEAPNGETAQ